MIDGVAIPTNLGLILLAAVVSGAGGFVSARWAGRRGRGLGAGFAVAATGLGLLGVGLSVGARADVTWPWHVPGGALALGIDTLSALFLVPVFLISGLGSIYGLAYWRAGRHDSGRNLPLFYGLLTAGMVLLLLARNSVLFLLGWEVMAVSAFFLVATDHQAPAARQAAWTYLVATHAGTSCLVAAFVLLGGTDGGLDWNPAAVAALPSGRSLAVFFLALLGFGLKAGVMPLHFWLPAAHAQAPSHVSAMLSGVMIKMGAYGFLRVVAMLPPLPAWCGGLVLGLGAMSALLGVAASLGQGDLKRLLAYSSIENIGIVCIGLGLAMFGRASGEATWVTLGLGGALLHVVNHSLFKPLLFLSAGSVIHATGTRRIDALGGLAKAMPRTALGFAVGAGAVSGLPVLNGFGGEFLVYLGLFHVATSADAASALLAGAAIAVLAMAGALAVAAFVRAFAAVFLGTPRSAAARAAHESPAAMTGVLAFLLLACVLLGMLPFAATPLVDRAVLAMPSGAAATLNELAPMHALGVIAMVTTCLITGLGLLLSRQGARAAPAGTWDCGYADPSSPRLQYTASSFAQYLLRLLAWAAPQRTTGPGPMDLFAGRAHFQQEGRERLLHGVLLPWCHRWAERSSRLRILQQGNIQVYLTYVLAILVLLLSWSVVEAWLRT